MDHTRLLYLFRLDEFPQQLHCHDQFRNKRECENQSARFLDFNVIQIKYVLTSVKNMYNRVVFVDLDHLADFGGQSIYASV